MLGAFWVRPTHNNNKEVDMPDHSQLVNLLVQAIEGYTGSLKETNNIYTLSVGELQALLDAIKDFRPEYK